ncbi:hypothetical protein CTZ24_11520 [Pantoea phytobeneficialis]|nr:hypothetical protein CTZ24_11520 [Pantoea phytobeneficialis]
MSGEESNHYTIASYAQELWEIAEKYLDKLRAIAEKDIGPTRRWAWTWGWNRKMKKLGGQKGGTQRA